MQQRAGRSSSTRRNMPENSKLEPVLFQVDEGQQHVSLAGKVQNVHKFTTHQVDLNNHIMDHVEKVEERLSKLEVLLVDREQLQEKILKESDSEANLEG